VSALHRVATVLTLPSKLYPDENNGESSGELDWLATPNAATFTNFVATSATTVVVAVVRVAVVGRLAGHGESTATSMRGRARRCEPKRMQLRICGGQVREARVLQGTRRVVRWKIRQVWHL